VLQFAIRDHQAGHPCCHQQNLLGCMDDSEGVCRWLLPFGLFSRLLPARLGLVLWERQPPFCVSATYEIFSSTPSVGAVCRIITGGWMIQNVFSHSREMQRGWKVRAQLSRKISALYKPCFPKICGAANHCDPCLPFKENYFVIRKIAHAWDHCNYPCINKTFIAGLVKRQIGPASPMRGQWR